MNETTERTQFLKAGDEVELTGPGIVRVIKIREGQAKIEIVSTAIFQWRKLKDLESAEQPN